MRVISSIISFKAIGFSVLILYPDILLNFLIVCRRFSLDIVFWAERDVSYHVKKVFI